MVTLHALPDMNKSGVVTFSQARTAHCFETASYTATIKPKRSKGEVDTPSQGDTQVKRDLLVVGCRKKVVVYGLGKSGMKEGVVSHTPELVDPS
jgi:D-arabinose 5-phosphate isomerase GutQ